MAQSSKIRFGVLGCSRVAKKSALPALVASDMAELVTVSSRDTEKARECSTMFNCEASATYEEVLNRADIDAVYISLPNALHAEWVLKAVAAGKHVWCEKPCALTHKVAQEIATAAAQHAIRVMEGFTFLFHPQHAAVYDLIEHGKLGNVQIFDGRFTFPYPDAKSSLLNAELGGGSLNDSAVYPIRASRMIFGSEPESVFCVLTMDAAANVDRKVDMILFYSEGRTAYVSSAFGAYFQSTYAVLGTEARVYLERAYAIPKERPVKIFFDAHDTITETMVPAADQFLLMIDAFCAELTAAKKNTRYEEDILAQARILDAARKSSAERRVVSLSEID
ncbi:MAG: Gfo/Idh/MocA family oxidoreductase [Patescibacteria group bacterium]|nr:Gfo/Idh/MocA family oxidoreductase [Patescibacteria group bacterium]